MLNKVSVALGIAAGLTLAGNSNVLSQCVNACPPGATDGPMSVLGLSAFRINPDGGTGAAIGTNQVSPCSAIRLRMALFYSPYGASGGTTVAFSGGSMVLKTASGGFSQDITPKAGVPTIGPLSETGAGGCSAGGTNFFFVDYDFDISAHQREIVSGRITFQGSYGPIGTVAYFCPPVRDMLSFQLGLQVNVAPPSSCAVAQNTLTCLGMANGVFQLAVRGPAGTNYVIEASSDLAAWVPIATNAIPSEGPLIINDPVPASQTKRFYRAHPAK